MERLKTYRSKRDFERTPEPSGAAEPAQGPAGRLFVIHKHASRRPHYDLRLEDGGVLRSWALPKGPSLRPGERRLAVQTEDHPLEYAEFEGVIPAGEYGGGTMMVWDAGRWSPQPGRRREGRLDIVLEGAKLRGSWALVRMGDPADDDGTDWLMIRRSDDGEEPAELDDRSVLSGRTMEEIERGEPPRQGEPTRRDEDAGRRKARGGAGPRDGARRAEMPAAPELQLATLVPEPPRGDAWIHEIKFDGYRVAVRADDRGARLTTRNGHDWTDRFPELAASLGRLRPRRALLDGEVVAMGPGGVSSFGALQEALSGRATGALAYQAFDLLHLDDHDLRGVGQLARKEALAELLSGGELGPGVRYSDHVVGKGPAFFAQACRHGLEGIVSKRADAPYRAGRGRGWLKVKCTRRAEFVVGGYTPPGGSRSAFGSLLLGAFEGDALAYAGRVGSGFGERTLRRLHERLRALERPTSPFAGEVPDAKGVTWVEPELVVEVEFTERTRDDALRHPTFQGLRDDRDPREIRVASRGGESEARAGSRAGAARTSGARSSRRRRGADDAEVAGVRLSNASRVLYPEQGITKLALAEYYVGVQEHVLPGLVGRPLALVRCPQGHDESCFYQKHPGDAFAPTLPRVAIAEREERGSYAYVETVEDLVGLVQAGVLELHVWGSRVDDLERPDLMVLDLDPSSDVPWSFTRRVAQDLRERIRDLGLEPFLRTTGGKGLHLVVPLEPRRGWDELKAFARALCERHAATDPKRLTTTSTKSKRGGKIFLDYLRNGRGATAIASYSTRARSGAPVAVPVRWDELGPSLRPDRYHVGNVRRRLAALPADPWEGFAAAARPLTADMVAAVGLEPDGGSAR